MKFRLILLWTLPFATISVARLQHHLHAHQEQRGIIEVGSNECPPGQSGCPPRGTDHVDCLEAEDEDGRPLFKGKTRNPCFAPAEADVECLWYAGFSEYSCECVGESDEYCKDPANALCLDGYENTKIVLNGGRTFWNCNVID